MFLYTRIIIIKNDINLLVNKNKYGVPNLLLAQIHLNKVKPSKTKLKN